MGLIAVEFGAGCACGVCGLGTRTGLSARERRLHKQKGLAQKAGGVEASNTRMRTITLRGSQGAADLCNSLDLWVDHHQVLRYSQLLTLLSARLSLTASWQQRGSLFLQCFFSASALMDCSTVQKGTKSSGISHFLSLLFGCCFLNDLLLVNETSCFLERKEQTLICSQTSMCLPAPVSIVPCSSLCVDLGAGKWLQNHNLRLFTCPAFIMCDLEFESGWTCQELKQEHTERKSSVPCLGLHTFCGLDSDDLYNPGCKVGISCDFKSKHPLWGV